METLLVPNEPFLDQVSEMLADGHLVTIRTKGNSMLPFIRGSRDRVELERCDSAEIGDIVLARIPCVGKDKRYRYVLHRIIGIDGTRVTLMGDGNINGTEHCRLEDISGKVICIINENGRRKDCRSSKSLRLARMWRKLLPLRRYILGIYRRLI